MQTTERARTLYPEIAPYDTGTLRVDDIHTLYYEQYGNPAGKPAVFLHGGPGGGCSRVQARFWNPDEYRAVLFDQRGCGKSKPHAELRNNTTWDLVSDIEAMRTHLGITRWQVFGGSWGSTLALAYATRHGDRITEMVLRGIFMLRKREIDWFYQEGASRLFPDRWEKFLAPIAPEDRHDLLSAYHALLTGPDEDKQLEAARAWSMWEGSTSTLRPNPDMVRSMGKDKFALAFARIEAHYFVNAGFFDDEELLLKSAESYRHLPAKIVQGRYDVVCPMESAWQLHKAWPGSNLYVAQTSGHSAYEPEILHHLVSATDSFVIP